MSISKEIEDEEFESLLADKRHREVAGTLKNIATSLLKEKDDKAIVDAIKVQGDKMSELVAAIKSIPKPEKLETPIVNVELNPQQFVTSINKICEDIVASNNKVIEALNNRLLPDTFILVRGYGGVTNSVKVNYKTAKEIKK